MYTLLVVILLFALLFDTAAATSPVIDPTLSAPPMESFYPDPEGILTAICDLCAFPLNICVHGPVRRVLPDVAASLTVLDESTAACVPLDSRDVHPPSRVAARAGTDLRCA